MALSNIWIVAEPSNGSFTTHFAGTAHAGAHVRRDTVSAITWGGDAALAAVAGEYGATTLYDVGDLGGALPGVPVASAIAALVASAGAPDAILIPTSYDGRDIAGRLSARLDRPVLTNVTGLSDDGGLVDRAPDLRWLPDREGPIHRRRSRDLRHPREVLRGRAEWRRGRDRRRGASG